MKKTTPLFLAFLICALFQLFHGGAAVYAATPVTGTNLGGLSGAQARLRLMAEAETYLGIPYRYGGADRRGLDCSGLIYRSFQDALHITVPRTVAGLYGWVERIPAADLAVGDLVFFVTEGSQVSHAGIYAGDGRFIHAASEGSRTGVLYSHLDESYWKRTFTGAGRILPWDAETGAALTTATGGAAPGEDARFADAARTAGAGISPGRGFFTSFGLALTWGKFIEGAPHLVRGIAGQARIGYQGFLHPRNMAALELRPEWDNALGVFRLPITLAFGTENFQVFAGPAVTIGDPELALGPGRPYRGFAWIGAVGLTGVFPPIKLGPGAVSFYGELCWQSYSAESGQDDNWKADVTANLRVSIGLRYSWFL
jgi:hypothetical protein